MFRAETELSKAVARQTYPLDGGNAALAPALRVQFEIPDGVIVPTTPEVRRGAGGGRRVRLLHTQFSRNNPGTEPGGVSFCFVAFSCRPPIQPELRCS